MLKSVAVLIAIFGASSTAAAFLLTTDANDTSAAGTTTSSTSRQLWKRDLYSELSDNATQAHQATASTATVHERDVVDYATTTEDFKTTTSSHGLVKRQAEEHGTPGTEAATDASTVTYIRRVVKRQAGRDAVPTPYPAVVSTGSLNSREGVIESKITPTVRTISAGLGNHEYVSTRPNEASSTAAQLNPTP